MHAVVNGVRIYFDIENSGLVADGARMREKPTLLLLHGGPGFDHSIFKPAWAALSDLAQIVYIDHRGNGRSDDGDPSTWNLAQWGDDVKAFCDALGIVKPIVSGTSFGGFVAQAYATRHPEHVGKLILISTAAKFEMEPMFAAFERVGGAEIRRIAEDRWLRPTPEARALYIQRCLPFYTMSNAAPEIMQRATTKYPVAKHFSGATGEMVRFDFRATLASVLCPTLVMAGEQDPMTPVAFSEVIAARLPHHLVQFERFEDCGHGVVGDQPERAFRVLREFMSA